jgi:hypothetical protein
MKKAVPPSRPAVAADDDEEEEEEQPVRPSKKKGESLIRGGWTDAQKQMDATSDFAQSLKLEEKGVLIKFLEDTSYANFRRHWIERSTKDGKSTRAYTCLGTVGKECPLCEVGDKPQAVAAYNVAQIGEDGQVLLKSWDCGPRLFNVLKGYANDIKTGPLTKNYFYVNKTGKRGTVQHNVAPVSRTALRDDYEIEPPSQEDLDALEKYTPEVIRLETTKTLREIAEEIADEYE